MPAPLVWRAVALSLLLCPCFLSQPLAAQSGGAQTSTSTCNLDDGRQVYIRYRRSPRIKRKSPTASLGLPAARP